MSQLVTRRRDDLLRRVGEALYGDRWQSPLARDLGISDRQMRRWVAGDCEIPQGVYAELLSMVLDRTDALDALVEPLKAVG